MGLQLQLLQLDLRAPRTQQRIPMQAAAPCVVQGAHAHPLGLPQPPPAPNGIRGSSHVPCPHHHTTWPILRQLQLKCHTHTQPCATVCTYMSGTPSGILPHPQRGANPPLQQGKGSSQGRYISRERRFAAAVTTHRNLLQRRNPGALPEGFCCMPRSTHYKQLDKPQPCYHAFVHKLHARHSL